MFINPHFDVVFVRRLFVCLFLFGFVVLVLLSLLKDGLPWNLSGTLAAADLVRERLLVSLSIYNSSIVHVV